MNVNTAYITPEQMTRTKNITRISKILKLKNQWEANKFNDLIRSSILSTVKYLLVQNETYLLFHQGNLCTNEQN